MSYSNRKCDDDSNATYKSSLEKIGGFLGSNSRCFNIDFDNVRMS